MNKKILSLILALVMVVTMLPANVFAVETGFTAAPTASETLATANPTAHAVTGPMGLGNTGASGSAEVTETGIASSPLLQSAEGDDISKYESQGNTAFTRTEEYELYAADETVTFIVVTENAPLLKKFSAHDIAAQTASVNAHKAEQENTLDAVKAETRRVLGKDMKIGFTYTIGTTGFSVSTAYGNKEKLSAMAGVKEVYVAPTFALPEDQGEQELSPQTLNSASMIGADVLNESGFTGKGMRIAILDTGILESHPSFQAMDESKLEDPMTRESVEEIWKTLSAAQTTSKLNMSYKSNKIPFAFNYANPGDPFNVTNTFAGSDHGTHVAGISAANPTDSSNVKGMAPDAQLIVMQVFQQGGGANWDTIMAALEDCVRLEVDAANLSLGAAAGFTDPAGAMLDTMNLFLDSDIQVLIASGNDTHNGYMNLWGGNMSLITNPDIGLTGTPASYSAAMTVASANNNGDMMLYFTVDGTDYGFSDTAATTETSFIQNFRNETLEYVMVPGIGVEEDYAGLDVTGKIAVISRGTTSFPEKQALAQAKGAIGAIIYNNAAGTFLMQINDGGDNIPCVSVSRAAGAAMAAAAGDDSIGSLTVCDADTKQFTSDTMMSDFSSWGVTPDLKLKPEITGVGGNIYSATDPAISGSYYGYMSGTSMATPQITGAMAVLLEYLEETYPGLTGTEQRVVAANILMSTANPIIHPNGLEYSPRNQGAGLADLVRATTAQSYLSNPASSESRPKAELGDDDAKAGVYRFSFEITNMSEADKTYQFSSSLLTETIVSDWFIGNEPTALQAKVTVGAASDDAVLCYDFNDDGAITTADARIILQFVAGKVLIDEQNAHYAYLDVNADGSVNAADAKVITDAIAELSVNVDVYAKATVPVNQVTVAAGETVNLSAEIKLTDDDKVYLDQFPNGIYVEGFLYATEVGLDAENAEPVRLTMPILGYYGDWSAPDVFDRDDLGSYSLYPTLIYAYYSDIGYNPYFRSGRSGDEYNYLSYANPLFEIDFGQLRNVRDLVFTVTDNETGEVYHTLEGSYLTKTHFAASYGMIMPTYLQAAYGELWDGKTASGKNLPDGTSVTYKAEAWLDDGDSIVDDTFSFQLTLDNTAPEILNAKQLQESLVFEGDRTYLKLDILENEKLAAVIFQNNDGRIMGKYELENIPGETLSHTFDITGFGSSFTIVVGDYAVNETEIEAFLNLGDQNDARPAPQALDNSRLYGCETFDGAMLEAGWFSVGKADFADPRNETFDSANRYYSAEYVNGYIVAQSAVTGHLELVTPSGSYWSSQILAENRGGPGAPGVWVLYDMALDHSGTLSQSYGIAGEAMGTDSLLAVGWSYKGDNDSDGKDDGYNALFNIKFTTYGSVEVQEIARIAGVADGSELLTLGITTEGDVYGIGTNGYLYSVAKEPEWDDTVGQYGANVIRCTEIGATDFVYYPSFGGANVIQSMGYDHNTGTMYWYAHSQVPVGYTYDNINVTYSIDLETGKCTEIGTYGPGGQTCLFVPNDLQSDLFTLGVTPTNMEIQPQTLQLVEGQTKRLGIKWTPWNAEPADVTWASADETIATIDEYGFVTALSEGEVTISASAEMMLEGHWDTSSGDWVWVEPAPGVKTVTCTVQIVPSEEALYGFVASNQGDTDNNSIWVTYSDKDPRDVSILGKFQMGGQDAFWNGGTYYNGYVYATFSTSFEENGVIYSGTELYRMKVNEGATPAETTLGEPERIGFQEDMVITALGFDYNTGRMYCVENQNIGGLGIIDLDTGLVDMLGQPNGDLSGGVYIPSLAVTENGTIVISDAVANLYTINPDTLTTRCIYYGSGEPNSAYYEAMCYDYNTGSLYWNPCDGAGASPLYLIRMPESEWGQATVVDMGDVCTKQGTQQTVLFAIPENEPETNVLPVESIEITNGDALSGLEGGTLKLNVVTVPARPTIQTKTWTSSDEGVVSVDRYGNLTFNGVGTATVTVSITNKDEATYGGPFTDSIEINVLESAGEFVAFLNNDDGGTGYYDFWLKGNDYDLRHTSATQSMIAVYSLRTGAYYDGYFYAYNDRGQFMRIDAANPTNYKVLGDVNLDITKYQVTGMAVDWNSGTMYGLTLPSNYDFGTWEAEEHPGELVTINLDNGQLTTVAQLSFETPVYALACDASGTLYAAGGSFDYYSGASTIYTLDKQSGELTPYATVPASIFTSANYYGSMQYNTQMTYDFGTDRLYLYATTDHPNYYDSMGMYMVQLGDEPMVSYLDGISLYVRAGAVKHGEVYLGLLAFIPEIEEVPVAPVNGITLNRSFGRIAVGDVSSIQAQVRPSNAADPSLSWSSSDEGIVSVDQEGNITGISTGAATITVKSNETGVTNQCVITVVELTGPQSTAYTVSAKKDSLVSFNPALPGMTAEVVTTLSGGSSIKGMCYGPGCIYFVQDSNNSYYIYRLDLLTYQVTNMGSIEAWTGVDALAYDAQNNLLYAAGGFYIFQYDMNNWKMGDYNSYSNYIMDSDYCTMTGLAVIDGALYGVGNDYYSSAPTMMKYSDKYLSDRTIVLQGFGASLVAGSTDFTYDPTTDLFYLTDAGHTIYTMDREGNIETVDILGDGIDINGFAIVPAAE